MKYLALLLVLALVVGGLFVLDTIYPFLPAVANIASDLGHKISDNWRGFLVGKEEPSLLPSEPKDTDDLDLDARIKAEVDKAVLARLAELAKSGGLVGDSGLVVVPANQSSSLDTIARSFSDEVNIYPDESGQSGVIVPVFRDGTGQPYLYIMTPIKK